MAKKSKLLNVFSVLILALSAALILLMVFIVSESIGVGAQSLVFRSKSAQRVYDGTPLTYEEFELIEGELDKGHVANAVFSLGRTDAGTSLNQFSVIIVDDKGNDVSKKYNISTQSGELVVLPIEIRIESLGAIKEYDSLPLVCHEYETQGELLANHSLEVSFIGERTDAGVSDNTFSAAVKDENNKNVSANYFFEVLYGRLEVLKRQITIVSHSIQKVYDGEPLACNEWRYGSDTRVIDGHTIEVLFSGVQLDAGHSLNTIGQVKVFLGENDKSYNYEFSFIEGDLYVLPRTITIRSESDSKIYNGLPLTNGNYSVVSSTKPIEGHSLTAYISGTRTEVEQSPNFIAEVIVLSQNADETHNYLIEKQVGVLVVKEPSHTPPQSQDKGIDDSGDIKPIDEVKNNLEGRVYSEIFSKMYLRHISFGDYEGTSWKNGEDYDALINEKYSFNYLTSFALDDINEISYKFSVESFQGSYILPYYLSLDAFSYEIQKNDVKYEGDTSYTYSGYYFVQNDLFGKLSLPEALVPLENNYRQFVYLKYLDVLSQTYAAINNIFFASGVNVEAIKAQGAPIGQLVEIVKTVIQANAVYNLNYDTRLDEQLDIAASFLADFNEGTCQHFASAATIMFRMLGIPARYTLGYAVNAKGGEWTNFYSSNLHAWTEIYVDGMGWIAVDTTPSDIIYDGGNDDDQIYDVLKIRPVDRSMKYYNGAVLTAENRVLGLDGLLKIGYSYEVIVDGVQSVIGKSDSEIIAFSLFDSDGNDVTGNYNIIFLKGKLQLYASEVTVTTLSKFKIYDGLPLCGDGTFSYSGQLLENHMVVLDEVTSSQTEVKTSQNSVKVKIVHKDGLDVTDMYLIKNDFGSLTVAPREITITAGSATSSIAPLSFFYYEITSSYEQALGEGHIAQVTISGEQSDIGRCENQVESVIIFDKYGRDVTCNYSIECISGMLTVVRP